MIEIKGNLILGVPKTGSQSLAIYILGRQVPFTHKKYSEYNRSFFNVYALWRDPVDRFKSALRFEWKLRRERKEKPRTLDDVVDNLGKDDLVFFNPQSYWLDEVPENELVLLPFSEFDKSLEYIADVVGRRVDFIPRVHKTEGEISLTSKQIKAVEAFYEEDYKYSSCLKMPK